MNTKRTVPAVVGAVVGVLLLGLMGTGCPSNRDSSGQDLSAPASPPANAYGGKKPAATGAKTPSPPGPRTGK